MLADVGAIDRLIADLQAEKAMQPPLKPPAEGGTSGDMASPANNLEPRVSRLEMGFCAAFVLIFAAIITSYLMLDGKVGSVSEKVVSLQVQQARDSAKLDAILDRLPKK